MIEKTTCKYCGWEFPSGFLQLTTENSDSVFCENCGTELINEKNISETIKSEENPTQDLKVEKKNKKKAIFNYIHDMIHSKNIVNRIIMDSDFPKVFKDNFKIVISRVIYSHIRAMELNSGINIKNVELTKEILDKLSEEINPVLNKRIKRKYLGNLHKSSIKDFEKWFKNLQSKLKINKRYHKDFIIYLRRLISEVYIIVSKLWDNRILPKYERIIRDDLKSNEIDLNSSLKDTSSRQELISVNQKKLKECGRCHQLLSYHNFYPVSKGSEKVRPYCKKCNSDLNLIRQNQKKLNIIILKYNGKCCECGLDDSSLPALQFHHQNPNKKSISWRDIKNRSYDYINRRLEEENIKLLCSNCHLRQQALIFKKYRKLILQQNLTQLTPEEINYLVLNSTKEIPKKLDRMHIREKIREWIKKRYVIEQLYEGICIGCEEVSVENNLTALEFHHSNSQIDQKSKWESLEILDTNSIIEQLISQKCVCLCSNCHSLIHSRFNEFGDEILKKFYNQAILKQKLETIIGRYEKIFENISNFKIKYRTVNNKPLLKLALPHTEMWKIHLLKIFYFSNKSEEKMFKAYDLKDILNITIRHVYKHLNRYVKQGYIEKSKLLRGKFCLTNSGLVKVNDIKKSYRTIANKIKIAIGSS